MAFFRFLGRFLYAVCFCVVFGLAAWVSFRYFLQGKSVAVPELAGLELEEAGRLVADKGLELAVESDLALHDDRIPVERIRTQTPRGGTPVRQGATVRVALSLGPRILAVPDLAGSTSRTAALALERIGLRLGTITTISMIGIGGVVAQEPPAGQRMGPGEPVSILVAHDPGPARRILPDYVGKDLEYARRELESFGYRLGSVRAEAYDGVPENRILRQFPLAGYAAPAGFSVSFVVSHGAGGASAPLM